MTTNKKVLEKARIEQNAQEVSASVLDMPRAEASASVSDNNSLLKEILDKVRYTCKYGISTIILVAMIVKFTPNSSIPAFHKQTWSLVEAASPKIGF